MLDRRKLEFRRELIAVRARVAAEERKELLNAEHQTQKAAEV
jgi:hypothetical protein